MSLVHSYAHSGTVHLVRSLVMRVLYRDGKTITVVHGSRRDVTDDENISSLIAVVVIFDVGAQRWNGMTVIIHSTDGEFIRIVHLPMDGATERDQSMVSCRTCHPFTALIMCALPAKVPQCVELHWESMRWKPTNPKGRSAVDGGIISTVRPDFSYRAFGRRALLSTCPVKSPDFKNFRNDSGRLSEPPSRTVVVGYVCRTVFP